MKDRLNVHIFVTPDCNLKCKHCYSSDNKVRGDILSVQEIVDAIKILYNDYDVYFDIEGGELFLRKDIIELLKILDIPILGRITITTNGTIFPEIDAKILKELDEFRVSIEGHTNELHSDIRGIGLEKILENCKNWINKDVSVVVRMTLNKKNYKYLYDSFKAFYIMGFRRFSFYEFQNVGRGKEYKEEYEMSEAEMESVFEQLCDISVDYDNVDYIKLSLSSKRDRLVNRYYKKIVSSSFSMSDISNIPTLFINYNGEIGVCPWNIKDVICHDFRKVDFQAEVKSIVEMQNGRHECEYCSSRRLFFEPEYRE
jgi:MoaA/NifB/PqqE/SkfB family radical SAM enzyme